MTNWDQIDDAGRAEILERAHENPAYFCREFLPHWFRNPTTKEVKIPWVHKGILAILTRRVMWLLEDCTAWELAKIESNFVWEDDNGKLQHIFDFSGQQPRMVISRHTLIMMPRGFSKTTLMNAVVLMWLLYQETAFPVYCSHAGMHAEMQMGNVKAELAANERIHKIFGNVVPVQRSGLKWSDDLAETTTGLVMAAKGRGSQIRGLNHRARRPSRAILDDFEDKESVKTAAQRVKSLEWVTSDVEPALPEMDPDASISILGTLLHRESALEKLRNSGSYTAIVFGAIDRQGDLLWPEMMDQEKLDRKKQTYAKLGQLHVFYMEYFNQLRNPDTQKFRPEMIHVGYFPVENILQRAIAIDPAISESEEADYCALAAVGIKPSGGIHILDLHMEVGMSPRRQVDLYFDFVRRFCQPVIGQYDCFYGVEANAYQAALVHLLREEMFRSRIYFEVTPLIHRQKKTERVEGILQPRYANGVITHQKNFRQYVTDLLDWPSGKKDGPDVVAQAVALLDPYAMSIASSEEEVLADHAPPLDRLLGGDWRAH